MPNTTTPASSAPVASNLPLQIGTATLVRFVINTARRFLYPFAPALSRGLGLPLTAITSLIALNQFTGLLSPFFGPLSDRWGYRTMMLIALSLLATGMLAIGLVPVYVVVALGIFLGGLGKSLYDPALQAYVGERVTYQRRGLVIGLIELSWAGSALLGIPLMGLLIDRFDWYTPFWVLAGLALVSLAAIRLVIPSDRKKQPRRASMQAFSQIWDQLRHSRTALSALAFGFFIAMANDTVFVTYGAWLERSFGLGLVALGTATTVIGLAEMGGETLVATVSDRLGLKRAVLLGVTLTTLSYALLPVIGNTLPLALAGLFFTFISFEFTIVTSFSLFTEALPAARATMMSSYLAMSSLGRMIGALLGGLLWLWGGMLLTGLVAAGLTAIGLGIFVWGLRSWRVQ